MPGDSQAYSAGSIPIIRSSTKPQVSDLGLRRCLDLSGAVVPSACPIGIRMPGEEGMPLGPVRWREGPGLIHAPPLPAHDQRLAIQRITSSTPYVAAAPVAPRTRPWTAERASGRDTRRTAGFVKETRNVPSQGLHRGYRVDGRPDLIRPRPPHPRRRPQPSPHPDLTHRVRGVLNSPPGGSATMQVADFGPDPSLGQ